MMYSIKRSGVSTNDLETHDTVIIHDSWNPQNTGYDVLFCDKEISRTTSYSYYTQKNYYVNSLKLKTCILDYCCCIKTLDLINIQFTMQNLQETPISNSCEPEKFKYEKWSYTEIFDKIQKFRKHKVFCDIKLATEEGNIIFGHKAVLASASPYLHAVFLLQHDKDTVVIGQY
ncbi:uncharacterized protein LOC107885003 isoform X1 [Acyrthosiphon pisum]|uniref:BTB domain-containing protein n=1 Tax=Acyrthosiphon pisum TaxID=7029 RepID=A0A8R2HBE6_ACYPI|nr:uncharacterized protein LOC107885003 isoform X1 [Acyrthosiphon pisum]|eukprot:XP_016663761.1 PREDICTED: uncharacterized protein LOC107885003 isoform X1 [Acyrthosiphon pisum]